MTKAEATAEILKSIKGMNCASQQVCILADIASSLAVICDELQSNNNKEEK